MGNKLKILITVFLILLISTLNTAGKNNDTDINSEDLILLKTGNINTDMTQGYQNEENNTSAQFLSALSMEDTENYYIVQFTGPVRDEWKNNVTSTGATICNYVPNNAFIVRMNENAKDHVLPLDFVRWVGEYRPEYKYGSELTETQDGQVTGYAPDTDNIYHVLLFPTENKVKIIESIESTGGKILSGSGNVLRVHITADRIPEIATISGVSWIEEYVSPTVNNDVAAGIINVNTVHETYGLNGSGQIVAVCDSGLDTGTNDQTMHADLRGRILSITDVANDGDPADLIGHGTHVAGSVLGNGSLSGGNYNGMAPEAELIFQAAGGDDDYLYLPDGLSNIFQPAYDLGARIHTNSWGSSVNGEYTQASQEVDLFMWEHPDMLILFSAGNSGIDSDENGVIDPDSIGSPATAKNCLTVGASENDRGETFGISPYLNWGSGSWLALYPVNPIKDDYMASNSQGIAAFSSRGPTDDGRIKPDVVAPGTFIASARSSMTSSEGWGVVDDNYLYMGGTSMSTPITAGTAALVREYYTEVENVSAPSAALIKATLINGALNLTPGQYGTGDYQEISRRPDHSQGWGRIDIENSIYPSYPGVMNYFDNIALNYTDSWNVSYDILYTSEPFRVTLVWTDYPGSAFVGPQLVNNLDLAVNGPDGIYYGNGKADVLNNVEGIELIEPVPGTYTITVNGTNIPQGPQNFSLVLSYGHDSTYMYPEHNSYTINNSTEVYINLTHADGIDQNTINMTIDDSEVIHSLENIEGGYRVVNRTVQPYTEGFHDVTVSALTNLSEELNYGWTFYVSTEENIIEIQGLSNNSVIQEGTFDINVSNNKWCDFRYKVNNGTNSTIMTGYSFNTTLNLIEGHHNITIFAEDITGFTNSTTVDLTVFIDEPAIDSPGSGTIYYLPDSSFDMNGNIMAGGVATNVSVYVNGEITNSSYPVTDGVFNITRIPLANGTNTINVSAIYNNSLNDYFGPNATIYLSLGETFDTIGSDEMTISVPGMENNVSYPVLDFNVTGTSANPGNISAAVVTAEEPGNGSVLSGTAVDIRVLNGSDSNYSHHFGSDVSLTLVYDTALVNDSDKLVVAWYDPEEDSWIPFRSTVNTSAHTVTANITHLSIYAPLEDNTGPLIEDLENSSTTSTVTLTWESSADTDHVEIWKNGVFLANYSDSRMTDPGLSSSTVYNYSLKPLDFVNNTGIWYNMSVTTDAVATTTPSTSGNSGGGGGGGVGGSTGEDFENIVFKDVLSVYAGKDNIVDFDFDHETNDIDYVRYLSLKNAGKITTTIEVLNNTSTFADTPVCGQVYRNINIWVGKTGYATEKNIKDPSIGFRVSRDWIHDHDIDPATIELKRYHEGKWQSLGAKKSRSDESHLYFETGTSGFSSFAITAEKTSVTEDMDKEDVVVEEDSIINREDNAETVVNTDTSPTEENETESTGKLPFISVSFTMLLLVIACVIARKQQD